MKLYDIEHYEAVEDMVSEFVGLVEDGLAVAIMAESEAISDVLAVLMSDYVFDLDSITLNDYHYDIYVLIITDDKISVFPRDTVDFGDCEIIYIEAGVPMSYVDTVENLGYETIVFSWDNDDWTDEDDDFEDDNCDYCCSVALDDLTDIERYGDIIFNGNIYGDVVIYH